MPSIREMWNFSDPSTSEDRFREAMEQVNEGDPFYYELQTQLARTFGLRHKFDEAHAILDKVWPHIETAPIVKVRYLLERGRTYNTDKEREKAIPLFETAWEIGLEAKLHFLAVDAAHMMAIVAPETETQIEWFEKAVGLAESTDQQDAKTWFGSLYNNLGWTYHDSGEYEKALEIFKKALAWREEQGHVPTIRIAKYMVARALRSLERYAEALVIQERLLAEIEASGDAQDGYVYEEIGENLLAMDRADDAKPYFKQAYDLLKDDKWVENERKERMKTLGGSP